MKSWFEIDSWGWNRYIPGYWINNYWTLSNFSILAKDVFQIFISYSFWEICNIQRSSIIVNRWFFSASWLFSQRWIPLISRLTSISTFRLTLAFSSFQIFSWSKFINFKLFLPSLLLFVVLWFFFSTFYISIFYQLSILTASFIFTVTWHLDAFLS